MNILIITTGGTIGSRLKDSFVCLDTCNNDSLLTDYYDKYKGSYDIYHNNIRIIHPFKILSENNDGITLKRICTLVKQEIEKEIYTGIIITHGTDTIQYTASALSCTLGLCNIPVCIVSSNYPIGDIRSNGLENLHEALQIITKEEYKGVLVPYRNKDKMVIHRGSRLLPHHTYSDELYSLNINPLNILKGEVSDELLPLSVSNLDSTARNIFMFTPYPGISYPILSDEVKYVIINSFHSGTLNTSSVGSLEFYKELLKSNKKVFITGAFEKYTYESTKCFDEFSLTPLITLSPIQAFIKLWFLSLNGEDIEDNLMRSLGADVLPSIPTLK